MSRAIIGGIERAAAAEPLPPVLAIISAPGQKHENSSAHCSDRSAFQSRTPAQLLFAGEGQKTATFGAVFDAYAQPFLGRVLYTSLSGTALQDQETDLIRTNDQEIFMESHQPNAYDLHNLHQAGGAI